MLAGNVDKGLIFNPFGFYYVNNICLLCNPVFQLPHREVPEWLKGHAWKACVRATVPRVRISPVPPAFAPAPSPVRGFSSVGLGEGGRLEHLTELRPPGKGAPGASILPNVPVPFARSARPTNAETHRILMARLILGFRELG